MAQRSLEPDQKLAQVALVGLECLVRLAALVREMREPGPDSVVQVLGERKIAVLLEHCRQTGACAMPHPPGNTVSKPRCVGLTGY